MTDDLLRKKCVPCEGGTPPLPSGRVAELRSQLTSDWELDDDGNKIKHLYKFADFVEAMKFVNKIAGLAEEEAHHPDISISYNKVKLELTTHSIGGLSENDFIMARKIEELQS